MWAWIFLGGYELFVLALTVRVAATALSPDAEAKRRETAYKMFRIIWPTAAGGVVTAVVRLHQEGLL